LFCPCLSLYIDASYAALAADVRAYQAEFAAAEAAHSKRRPAELKAERAAEPSAPERVQPTRASKRACGSA
jgi:multidrug efflux pump subunit AcrA (membrane-fusion protein)